MTEFISTYGPGRIGLDRMAVLLTQANFVLAEPYLSELLEVYGYVQRISARVHGYYRFDEEPAHVFDPRAFEQQGDDHE